MKNKTTTYDIAKMAGISQTAVSNILNNKGSMISERTRQRVHQIVRELNYRPNYFARSLKSGKTNCIGLMGSLGLANFSYPYFSNLTAGIEDALAEKTTQYSLNIFGANYNQTYEKSVEMIKKGLVDGLIFIILSADLRKFEQTLRPILDETHVPFVVIHSTSQELGYNHVGLNSFHGAYLAGQHLAGLKHPSIWFYRMNSQSPQVQEMFRGFRQGLAEAGFAWREDMVLEHISSPGRNDLYDDAYRTLLAARELPPALFVPNDQAAAGVLRALQKRGVRVPADAAVATFDNALPIAYFKEELTAVRHPIAEKAATAVAILLDILDGKKDRDQVHGVVLKPYLDIKTSTVAGQQ